MIQPLNFPTYELQLRENAGATQLWDIVRKKWIVITPEEWVRQHLIHYLNKAKQVPLGLMSVEKKLEVNGLVKRTDLVVYHGVNPVLICECKAPQIKLSQAAMDQAARYNLTLEVPLLLITNGLQHYCCTIDREQNQFRFLNDIPPYEEMKLIKSKQQQ